MLVCNKNVIKKLFTKKKIYVIKQDENAKVKQEEELF